MQNLKPLNYYLNQALFNTSLTLYCLCNNRNIIFFQTDESSIQSLKNSDECQMELIKELNFFKINKQYWINLNYVSNTIQFRNKNYCELINRGLFQIAKKNSKDFENKLKLQAKKNHQIKLVPF